MAKKKTGESLHKAKKAKNDEFYTQLSDIENELKHYTEHFEGKAVFCNCDDPYESWFFKYFAMNFNQLKLKKLIATCYSGSPVAGIEFEMNLGEEFAPKQTAPIRTAYKIEIQEVRDMNGDGAISMEDIELMLKDERYKPTVLKDNGDFRSAECIELLKQADIVVTNPPFSLFREYVKQLMEYEKKFLIIGNQNSVTYKEIFKLIKENKIWLGINNGSKNYVRPDGTLKQMGNTGWFTNLEHNKRHEFIDLYKHYTPEEYPKYDNYDAINVGETAKIPMDYDGVMGVPISFMDKYNPEQFEIVRFRKGDDNKDLSINGECPFFRILIRKKQ